MDMKNEVLHLDNRYLSMFSRSFLVHLKTLYKQSKIKNFNPFFPTVARYKPAFPYTWLFLLQGKKNWWFPLLFLV